MPISREACFLTALAALAGGILVGAFLAPPELEIDFVTVTPDCSACQSH